MASEYHHLGAALAQPSFGKHKGLEAQRAVGLELPLGARQPRFTLTTRVAERYPAALAMKTDKKLAARLEIFTKLCDELAPDDKLVRTHVLGALTDPDGAAKQIQRWDDDWSTDETTDNLAWVTLAMALVARKRAFAIDYRAPAVDVMRGLAMILPKLGHDPKKLLAWYDKSYEALEGYKLVAKCGEALSAHKLALVWLDLSSGIEHVTVIPAARLAAAQTLGRRVRERVVSYYPKTPLKKPLAPASRAAKASANERGATAKRVTPKKTFLRSTSLVAETTPRLPVFNVKHAATLFQLSRSAAPKKVPLAPLHATSVAMNLARDTTLVAGYSGDKPALVVISGRGAHPLPLPEGVSIERVAFVGDVGVSFPHAHVYGASKHVKGPYLVEAGAKSLSAPAGLLPVKVGAIDGLGRWKSDAFANGGAARTGSGLDVLVFGGSGYVRNAKTRRFERVFDVGTLEDSFSAVAGEGDSFFVAVRNSVFEIQKGKPPRRRLTKLPTSDHPHGIQQGEGDALVVGCFLAAPKDTACVVWWPKARVYQLVPAKLFAVARGHYVEHVGYDPATKLLWWVSDDQLFTLPWSVTEGLPRLAEDTGRRV